MAERIFSAGIDGYTWLELPLLHTGQVCERAVVVQMSVAHNERIRPCRIDPEDAVVVKEIQLGEAEIEKDLAPLRSVLGLQVVGQAVLGQERGTPGAEGRALNRDRVELTSFGKDVVDVVHHVGHHEAVDDGHGRALRKGRAAAGPHRTTKGEDTTRDRP